jgi:hypothetical protein
MERPNMTVNLFGIMYFGICGDGAKRILLPNGTTSDGHIPPHFASIFVEETSYLSDDWWPTNRIERPLSIENGDEDREIVNMIEFRIPAQALLEFPDGQGGLIDLGNLPKGLLHMREIDPKFVPDFRLKGDWIAQIRIRSGDFQAFTLNGGVSAVQWQIRNDGALKITAKVTATGERKSVTVRSQEGRLGTEVVLMNAPDLLARAAAEERNRSSAHHFGPARVSPLGHRHTADEIHHFKLYGKINVSRDATNLSLPRHRQSIPSDFALFKVLKHVDIQAGCSSTCC